MAISTRQPECIACGEGSAETPLIELTYRSEQFWICPRHLPVLIHNPKMLAGKLPGAEGLAPADHHG
ncbi:MAG TPA: hypothetical protein VMW43_03070 [Bacteroidota bacterium]|nr:hypothetical protein [Bacteroidota bacterium]